MSFASKKGSGSLLLAWQVKNRHCLVIGGGDVALSRIHHLIIAGAKITVVSGEGHVHPEIDQLYKEGMISKLEKRKYQSDDLKMYEKDMEMTNMEELNYEAIEDCIHNQRFETVCCCIDDHELSTKIYYQCKLLRINANIADKPPLCDFYFGSMINKDSLQIMISTNGKSPRMLKLIKDTISKQFDDVDLNKAIENLNMIRGTLRQSKLPENDVETIETRMSWIKLVTDKYSIRQWSSLDVTEENVKEIVDYYPEYPGEFEEVEKMLKKAE